MMQPLLRPRWSILIATSVLVCLVFSLFSPILEFDFVSFDVQPQVLENPRIRGLTAENLMYIFATSGSGGTTTSYYPIRTLTYAMDFQIWGLDPGGFKLTNLLIHLANVLLVAWLIWRLIRRSEAAGKSPAAWWTVSVATLAASLFAVHPVVVEPVTWVAGREELLMTLGVLGCFHFHLTARHLHKTSGKTRWVQASHMGAALCCLLSCLSNAVAAVIPLLITACDLLTLRTRKVGRIVWDTSPLWMIGLATIVVKRTGTSNGLSDHFLDMEQAGRLSAVIQKFSYDGEFIVGEIGMFTAERLMLILKVYWMNLKTLLWPAKLTITYTLVTARSFQEADVMLGGLAVVLTCLALWLLRRKTLILFGLVWFGLALGPSSQIMPHHIHRADRFLYLPLVGLAVAVAMGLRPLVNLSRWRVAVAGVFAAGVLYLFALHMLSVRQVQTWRNSITMWENVVRVAPDHLAGRGELARLLTIAGQPERAKAHLRANLRLRDKNVNALNKFARYLATCDDKQQRDYHLAIKLAKWADGLIPKKNPEVDRTLAMVYNSFAADLAARRKFVKAIDYYQRAIAADPEFGLPLLNLALLLATCDNTMLRRPGEAVRLAEKACSLDAESDANNLRILAETYAQAGRHDMAIGITQKAIQLLIDQGDSQLLELLRSRLELYRKEVIPESSPDQSSHRPQSNSNSEF